MKSFFAPRGVMVIGASASPEKLGAVMATSLDSSGLPVARVNPRATEDGFVASAAEAAEAIVAMGGQPDLAVICVPAPATALAIAECAAAGVTAALVCSGGFSEAGPAGIAIEAAVKQELDRTGMRLLGPNTSGYFSPGSKLIASFVPGAHQLTAGNVALVAASGGVNHMLAFRFAAHGIGLSLGVGIGTGIDVDHTDVLNYLATDENTDVIALHIENVDDGPRLLSAVRAAAERKPVVALVVGENNVSEFAQSHTGALATSWRTTRSVLAQAGAVIVDSEEQLISAVIGLRSGRLHAESHGSAALITGQAGPGLLIADALASAEVDLPPLAQSTQDTLGTLLPPITFQANPVDTGRPSETFPEVISTVAADQAIDVVGIYGLTEPVLDMVASVRPALAHNDARIVVAMDGPPADIAGIQAQAVAAGVPFVTGPHALADALSALIQDRKVRPRAANFAVSDKLVIANDRTWDENSTKDAVGALGIPTPRRCIAHSREEAHQALTDLSGPLAVKILFPVVLHKTDVGGVHLNVSTPEMLDVAWDALEKIGAEQVLLEQMAPGGVDLIVGARRDPVFGPIVLLGLGGTTAEAVGDVAIRSAPLSPETAAAMIDDLAASQLLFGWRGGPTVDPASLGSVLSTLGGIVATNDWIEEVEINPLRITDQGLIALDSVLITRGEGQ
ncbi:acyl-CoA synthetase (NDP forming) [Aurantimicrobium minutum]|uniref:acetate--CoA ligase family protein n=1 Tax=Aurantimicrobium minutum TaxID=708131 RepID=UPI00247580EA|nr:acetate--CoA ligase family protein [Aurantimicrobium minutum]MDH6532819.1 acyl-CoA synthetase (NDP forming) [Aurantimicrobium minutum]